MEIVVDGLGVLCGKGGIVKGLVKRKIHVPGPIENGQRFILLQIPHLCIGQRNATKSIGKHPGIGHDLVCVDQAILGKGIFIRHLVPGVGLLSRGGLIKRDLGRFGKGHCDLQITVLLRSVLHDKALGNGGRIDPSAHRALHVLDAEQIFTCRLLVKA